MIERLFELASRIPPKAEVAIGTVGTVLYAAAGAFPEEAQDVTEQFPIGGEIYEELWKVISAETFETGAILAAILCAGVAIDGAQKIIAKKSRGNQEE